MKPLLQTIAVIASPPVSRTSKWKAKMFMNIKESRTESMVHVCLCASHSEVVCLWKAVRCLTLVLPSQCQRKFSGTSWIGAILVSSCETSWPGPIGELDL